MSLKRLAMQSELFRELPAGMQLRKRQKTEEAANQSAVQQQIDTTDYQEFQLEDFNGQEI